MPNPFDPQDADHFEGDPDTPPAETSAAGEWTLSRDADGTVDVDCNGQVVAVDVTVETLLPLVNASLAALREQLAQATKDRDDAVEKNLWLVNENLKLQAALKQKDEALLNIRDFCSPDSQEFKEISEAIAIQPDSSALNAVIEATDSGSETLTPQTADNATGQATLDTERLDWIEATRSKVEPYPGIPGEFANGGTGIFCPDGRDYYALTVRGAIDKARGLTSPDADSDGISVSLPKSAAASAQKAGQP